MSVLELRAQTDIALPELVRDLMLPVTIENDVTIHPQLFARRNKPREHIWVRAKTLGRGGYGDVWLEKKVEGDDSLPQLRAVKSIRMPKDETILELNGGRCVRELEALAKFSQDTYQQFFVKSYGWYTTPGSLNIAMEYCKDGDLQAYLELVKTIPTQQVHEIALQVLGGLASMHGTGFAHRDLKPANILIKTKPPQEWWVKLCDFGLSKRHEGTGEASTVRGTPSFMAPETLGFPFTGDPKKANPYSADMWCFGETLFRCHTGHATFEDKQQLYEYQQGKRLFPSAKLQRVKASGLALNFIRQLMLPLPSERLDTAKAKAHPWMRDEEERGSSVKLSQDIRKPRKQQSNLEVRGSRRRSEGSLQVKNNEITEASGQWSATDTESFPPPRQKFEPGPQEEVLNPDAPYRLRSRTLRAVYPQHLPTQPSPLTRRDHRSGYSPFMRRLESGLRLARENRPDSVEASGAATHPDLPLPLKTSSKPSRGLPERKDKEISPGKNKNAKTRKVESSSIQVVEEQRPVTPRPISQIPMGGRARPVPHPRRPSSRLQTTASTENKNPPRRIGTPDSDGTHSSTICNAPSSVKGEKTRDNDISEQRIGLNPFASAPELKGRMGVNMNPFAPGDELETRLFSYSYGGPILFGPPPNESFNGYRSMKASFFAKEPTSSSPSPISSPDDPSKSKSSEVNELKPHRSIYDNSSPMTAEFFGILPGANERTSSPPSPIYPAVYPTFYER